MRYGTRKPTSKIWIGNLYPASAMYRGEGAETVGQPLVNKTATLEETVLNRRAVRGHMNMLGLAAMRRVATLIQKRLGLKPELVFSQKAGCGMCPCSPGFMIKVELPTEKADKVRELFSKYGYPSLAQTWYPTNKDGSKNYNDRRVSWGVREVGVSFWGEVKKGRVKVGSFGQKDTTDKCIKAIREILKEK